MTVPSSVNALVVYGTGDPTAVVFSWSGGTPIYIDNSTGNIWVMVSNTPTKVYSPATIQPTSGYKSVDGSAGINTTITTGLLVGKTVTVKNGLITGFA